MNRKKRRLEMISLYDHTGIERHLKKMAEKGWLLDRIGAFGWVYRRTEPKTGEFAVTYYPKASEFDPEPSEGQKMYQDFSAHSGWEFICSSAQMQVFYNEQQHPTALETEPVMQVSNIHQAAKKSFLLCYFLLLGVSLLNGAQIIARALTHPISTLASPIHLFAALLCIILFAFCVTELLVYYHWLRKAEKAAEHGEFTDTPNTTPLHRIALGILLATALIFWIAISASAMIRWILALMFGYTITLILIVNAVKHLLKRKKVSRNANLTVTLVINIVLAFAMTGLIVHGTLQAINRGIFETGEETYEYQGSTYSLHQDELPLSLEDLIDIDYDGFVRECDMQETFLLAMVRAYQHPRWDDSRAGDIPSLEYNVAIVKAPFLYDLCKKTLLDKYDPKGDVRLPHGYTYQSVDSEPWGAAEAYQLIRESPMPRYLLCYEDCLVEIFFDWEPTALQMQTVGRNLGSKW